MFTLNGNPISIDNEYTTEEGVTYPHLRDPSVREQLGVIEVPDPQDYDQRFYWGVNNPKQLDDTYADVEIDGETVSKLQNRGLKYQWCQQVKATAHSLLAPTDWVVMRQLLKGIGMSAIIENYRNAVVDESNRLEAAISACNTVEELISVINNQNWPAQ